jgi:choline dehydrogenase
MPYPANYNYQGFEKLPPSYRASLSPKTLAALADFPSDWPEIEILAFGNAPTPANASTEDNFMLIGACLLATTSYGNVTINSTDTNDRPVVNPRFLTSIADQEVAVEAFKRMRQLGNAMDIIIAETSPGDAVQSDAQILEFIQSTASLTYHAAATCKLAKVLFFRKLE